LRLAADYEVLSFLSINIIKLLTGKIILNIFSFRSHRSLKPRSIFILKNLFFVNSKLNGRKLELNTPLIQIITVRSSF